MSQLKDRQRKHIFPYSAFYSVQTLNRWDVLAKGMIHVSGGVEQNGIRFHLTPQNSMEFKYNELFISGFFSFNSF